MALRKLFHYRFSAISGDLAHFEAMGNTKFHVSLEWRVFELFMLLFKVPAESHSDQ